MSMFYHFRVAQDGLAPTTTNKIRLLNDTDHCANYQLSYIQPAKLGPHAGPHEIARIASPTGGAYDFVGTQERFDESMVCCLPTL